MQILPPVHEAASHRRSARALCSGAGFCTAVICVLLALTIAPLRAADEVGEILKQIKAEKSGVIKPDKPSALASSSQASPRKKPKSQQASEKPRRQSENAARSQPKPTPFAMPIYGPKDKLPRRIAGHGLVGEFFVLGEYINGGVVLYATEDEGRGLIRQYVVVNRTSGLPPGNCYDQGRRPMVRFSREQPLEFVKKMFPGLYAVNAP